jgi:acetyl-CoA synthetase
LAKNHIGILNEIKTAESNFVTPYTSEDQNSHFHFTSGSTGKPKGVQHVHGGASAHLASFMEVIQPEEDDIYWCTADPGWVTGTTYGIFAPWMSGLTQIQFAGNFNSSGWMQIIEDHKVNILYSAPTVFRMLMLNEDEFFSQFDLSSLKRIYCVGEPLNPVIITWGRRVLEKDIFDTWFQTETGSILIANRPGTEIRPGSMGKSLSYINAQILDTKGKTCLENEEGLLCIKTPWASMFSNYINNSDIYQKKFFGEYYSSGDIAHQDEDGYVWFVGRNDDIINTAGHLVSPFEVESALLEIPEIVDAGVVAAPDDILYEKVLAFIVLRGEMKMTTALELRIKLHISKVESSIASPREIICTTKIPKTKSGKIMRRLLKNQYLNLELGDTSTLED